MPTKSFADQSLDSYAGAIASGTLAQTPRGGSEFGFDGSSSAPSGPKQPALGAPAGDGAAAPEQPSPFAGLGPWLEDDDKTVYDRAHNLVLRQELIAQNRLALDTYYTRVKLGYSLQSRLSYDPETGIYKSALERGTKNLAPQAVPNKAWDLVSKAAEILLIDPAKPDPAPLNDSEEAERAAEMAQRFLVEDAGEHGTNDIRLFYKAVDKSLTCATSYIEAWTDPVGGGYVPLQILAHPQAVSPQNPTIGPDGNPTPNMVLRYVTAPDETGQFTDDPSQAAPQWQPKIRGSVWGREHWRVFPESQPVSEADKVIGLLYCTLAEAKRRWPDVAAMEQADLDSLLSWTPPRYIVLLPPFQRARWKTSAGADKEKAGSSDERLMFYYRVLQKANPEHPKGAEVIVTGALGGRVLYKEKLAVVVKVPTTNGPKMEVRCMDIPLVQVTPRDDPDDSDPTGRCYLGPFCGATQFNEALATGFLEALDKWLHPDTYIPSTSSVQGFQVEESRISGDAIPILRREDMPQYGNQPPIPPSFFEAVEWNERAIDSSASLNKPVTGADNQQEVSGKARQIAVQQAMVGLNRMQQPVNASHERWYRIKPQLAMRDFSTPQMLRYVGEDGSHKEEEWTGTDFALVGNVGIQAGTGTMLPPEQKVQFIANLMAEGMLPRDEAADAARPMFAQRLGLPDDPHKQFVERCTALWLKGPPTPQWADQWQLYQQQKQAFDQAQAAYQQQLQAFQVAMQNSAIVNAGPAQPLLGPESQNSQVNTTYEQARIALAMNPLGPQPVAPQITPPVPPFTPFPSRPNETEPAIAEIWRRELSRVQSTAKYDAFIPEWRQVLDLRYMAARQAVALAAQPAQPQPGASPGTSSRGTPGSQPPQRSAPQPTRPTQPTAPTPPAAVQPQH